MIELPSKPSSRATDTIGPFMTLQNTCHQSQNHGRQGEEKTTHLCITIKQQNMNIKRVEQQITTSQKKKNCLWTIGPPKLRKYHVPSNPQFLDDQGDQDFFIYICYLSSHSRKYVLQTFIGRTKGQHIHIYKTEKKKEHVNKFLMFQV